MSRLKGAEEKREYGKFVGSIWEMETDPQAEGTLKSGTTALVKASLIGASMEFQWRGGSSEEHISLESRD